MKVLNNLDLWGKLSLSASANDAQKTEDFALLLSSYSTDNPGLAEFTLCISTNVRFFDHDGAGGYSPSDRTIQDEIVRNAGAISALRKEFDTMMGDETSITGVVDTFNEIKLFLDDYSDSDLQTILDAFVAKNSANTVGENFALEMEDSLLLSPRSLSLRNGDYEGTDGSKNPELHLMNDSVQYWMKINNNDDFELANTSSSIFRTVGKDVEFEHGISLKIATFHGEDNSGYYNIKTHNSELEINGEAYLIKLSSGISFSGSGSYLSFNRAGINHPNIEANNESVNIMVPSLSDDGGLKIREDEILLGTSSYNPLLYLSTTENDNILPYIHAFTVSGKTNFRFKVGTDATLGIQASDTASANTSSMAFKLDGGVLKLLRTGMYGSSSFQIMGVSGDGEHAGTTLDFNHIRISSGVTGNLYGERTPTYDRLVIGTLDREVIENTRTYYHPHIELRSYFSERNSGYIALGTDTDNEAIKIGDVITIRDFELVNGNNKAILNARNNTLNVNGNPVLTSDNIKGIYTFETATYTVDHSYGPYPKVTVYELGSGGEYNIVYANVSNKDNSDGTYRLTVGVAQAGSYVLNVGY